MISNAIMTCLCSPVDLVINLRQISFAPELFTDPRKVSLKGNIFGKCPNEPVIKRMVKHCSELVPGHGGLGIHHLEAPGVPDKLLHPPETLVGVKPLLTGNSVHADINKHLVPVRGGSQHPSLVLDIKCCS